jgi:hypothetical protein
MRPVRIILISAAAVAATVGLATAPAAAAPTGSTTTTFVVSGGTLDITVPATATIGTGAPGTTITGQLGTVTVIDTRGADPASWSASVTSTDFTTGGGGAGHVVLATSVDYASGPSTATTGDGTFTPSGAAAALNNTTPLVAFTHTGGTGNNSAAWNPTLNIHAPLASVAGTYTGTVTHSVA